MQGQSSIGGLQPVLGAAVPALHTILLAVGLSVSATSAQPSLVIVSDRCSELGCCFQLGSTFDASVVAVPNGQDLGAHHFDLLYDPALLQLNAVVGPDSGPFADVPVQHREGSPGVVTLGGLSCDGIASTAQELAGFSFSVIALGETQTSLSIDNEQLLSADETGIAADPADQTVYLTSEPDVDCDLISDAVDNCPEIFNPGQDPFACAPLLVVLSRFEAERLKESVIRVTWETAQEQDNAGFNLYRAFHATGPWEQLNDGLIPARGSELEGATYEYRDVPGRESRAFYYRLEDIDLSGKTTIHGPITVARRPAKRVVPGSRRERGKR